MSRIFGTYGELSGGRDAATARLVDRLTTHPRWVTRQASAGHATLAWCGEGAASLAARGEVVAVLDGQLDGDDAATVVSLYGRHGFAGVLARLDGDFAVALYDGSTDTLWLGRDRFGVRPLYYAAHGRAVAFASRPRPLREALGAPLAPDGRFVALFAASHYRVFDNDLAATPYRDVRQVPPAHAVRCRAGAVTSERYWELRDTPDLDAPEAELAARYRALLLDAVGRRLRGARRPAFTLSGGMDSSSVVGAAVALGQTVDAFSAVYDDPTFDERDDIRVMTDAMPIVWRPVSIGTPDLVKTVERMIAAHDGPVATATWLSHHALCEAVAEAGHDRLLGGLGGDELNAGEYEHFLYHFADLRAAGDEAHLADEIGAWARHHDHPVFRKDAAVAEAALARLVDGAHPGRCRPDLLRLRRYAGALDPAYFDLDAFEPVMEHPFRSYLKNRTYQDLTRETLPCCLRAADFNAAAFGLGHAEPFLDRGLAELMFRVPGHLKIRDGIGKRLLREAVRGLVPEATRTRIKKTGWNAPAHRWFSGAGLDLLRDLAGSARFRARGIYRVEALRAVLDDHERIVASATPRENHMMFLWQLLNLELWLRSLEDPACGSRS